MVTSSKLYFIQAGLDGAIKIGLARDPRRRLIELQVGNPSRLVLIGSFPGNRKLEKAVHEALRDSRLEGEWFEETPELRTIFQRLSLVAETDDSRKSSKPFHPEIAICRSDGGGGNRTRVTFHAESVLSSENASGSSDDDPSPPLVALRVLPREAVSAARETGR